MIFDTHAHLNANQYAEDLKEVLERAELEGVSRMLVVGFDKETIGKALQLAETYSHIYAAVGFHPVDAIDFTDEDLIWLESLCKHEKVVALGEMGLDYYWDKSPKEKQKEIFVKQLEIAKRVKLPVIIHNRDATNDVLTILEQEEMKEIEGVMHCFGGSYETAERCMKLNFYLSIGGSVTFNNAKNLQEVVSKLPLEKLLVETDCPYLTPHPFRGKRNEPSYIKHIVEKVAMLQNESFEKVAQITTRNANNLFKI